METGSSTTRATWRWHLAGAELLHHPLEHIGMGRGVGGVDSVQRQTTRLEPVVVTGDAVALEQRALGLCLGTHDTRRQHEAEGERGEH